MFSNLALLIGRLSITAWVGAAVLFVVTSVLEITSGQFASDDIDRLIAIRFPPYYRFGGISLGAALIGVLFSGPLWKHAHVRWGLVSVLITIASALMAIDYYVVFTPLMEMITPPGQPRPQKFQELHQASEMINGAGLLISFVAAVLVNWPMSHDVAEEV